MKQILLVGAGGFIGSISRYVLGGWVHRLLPMTLFPVGTLAVNVAGCFGIGVLAGLVEFRQLFGPDARLFLIIGVLGGFTTFSSFAHETAALAREGEMVRALVNVLAQTLAGLVAAALGYALTRS